MSSDIFVFNFIWSKTLSHHKETKWGFTKPMSLLVTQSQGVYFLWSLEIICTVTVQSRILETFLVLVKIMNCSVQNSILDCRHCCIHWLNSCVLNSWEFSFLKYTPCSDSWEQVSVGDCNDKPEKEIKMESSGSEEGFEVAGLTKTSEEKKVNIERTFRYINNLFLPFKWVSFAYLLLIFT